MAELADLVGALLLVAGTLFLLLGLALFFGVYLSPPWPAARAWASVMIPLDVLITAMPRPFWIFGRSSLPRY